LIDKLRAEGESNWTIYSLPQTNQGHVQAEFNNQADPIKYEAYIQFLTELYIIQQCQSILCTLVAMSGDFYIL